MSPYLTAIGLEFHVELKTESKLFCSCPTRAGAEPNTQVCPICLGLPGVLPVLNKRAVELAVMAGLALNCHISEFSKFDRKNYFYPDLPKGYQVTQYPLPICRAGHLLIEDAAGRAKQVRINRIHLEEDAGKLVHSGDNLSESEYSLPDYNRAAVPLVEIVTEPDMAGAEEARDFAAQLKLMLAYAGVSDVKMEQGSLRCDVNISLRAAESDPLGIKVEIKNLNSFRSMQRAIIFEQQRQSALLDSGKAVLQETRLWDEAAGETRAMRSKEDAHDYRYFPEPDLVPLVLDEAWIAAIGAEMPEMPGPRRERLINELSLSAYDAGQIVGNLPLARFFDRALACFPEAKTVANWLLGDISRLINDSGREYAEIPLSALDFAVLLTKVKQGEINTASARIVLEEMFAGRGRAEEIIARRGFAQISDSNALRQAVAAALAANPQPAADYRSGHKQALGFLVGQVMKETKGQANPGLVRQLLQAALEA